MELIVARELHLDRARRGRQQEEADRGESSPDVEVLVKREFVGDHYYRRHGFGFRAYESG
jgi:hypothetical protein